MGGTIWVIEGAPPPGESRGPHFITQAPIEVLNLLPSALLLSPRLFDDDEDEDDRPVLLLLLVLLFLLFLLRSRFFAFVFG